MNTIIWKGIPSTRIEGLLICDLPPITKPPLRVKETTIDGLDGSIIEELGYDSYDKSITIGLRGAYNIDQVVKYFTGEGEIVFSNEPDKAYTAKIVSQIDYNRLLRFRQAVIKFRVQPFKHKYLEAYNEAQTTAITGTSITVKTSEDVSLKTFSIYGKTTQNGTPTPDSPVDLVSVGTSGSVVLSVKGGDGNTQTIAVQTPNGLRGIPVSSGGNYTDANGQQWVCDEIDLARGVYVQRVHKLALNTVEGWRKTEIDTIFQVTTILPLESKWVEGLCTHFQVMKWYNTAFNPYIRMVESGKQIYFEGDVEQHTTVEDWVSFLVEEAENGTPVELLYVLATPLETAMSAEELEAYANMHTDEPNTTVLNDANAHMKVEYFKPFEVFNEGLEDSKPIMVLRGSGTVGISVNGIHIFDYTFPEGENEVVIDSQAQDAYLGNALKNRNMNGEFPILLAGTNKIEWSGYVESIEILPRSRWL